MSSKVIGEDRTLHPADRCHGIIAEFRKQIVSGRYRPGDRLPTRRELVDACGTTLVTVQKALSRLEAAGFICSRGREGSYVAERPPHLFRFGIVFAELPTTGSEGWYWSNFWSVLAAAAHSAADRVDRELISYSGVGDWSHGEDAHRLIADASGDRLAGLITAGPVSDDSPLHELIRKHQIPTVQIAGHVQPPAMSVRFGMPHAWISERLASLGCQSAAVLMPEFLDAADVAQFPEALNAVGISARVAHIMGLDPRDQRWIRHWTRLLMESSRPPQALWITDDNLVQQVALGLSDAGVVVGRDLQVVANATFPLSAPSPRGFMRYGVDMRQVMDECFAKLLAPRGTSEGESIISPQWMEEVAD